MPKSPIARKASAVLKESVPLRIAFYIATYPFFKTYLDSEARRYSEQLVRLTETPYSVLKEPIIIEPSIKSSATTSILPFDWEPLESRKNKERVYIPVFLLNEDTILEELSHTIRDRIHRDKDNSVAEFFGMVGKILIKDSKIHYNIPTIKDLERWRYETELLRRKIDEAKGTDKAEMSRCDKNIFVRMVKQSKLSKEITEILVKATKKDFFSNAYAREVLAERIVKAKYMTVEKDFKSYLKHINGYEAALRNREVIENNPKGIYLLSEEEVKQRFFKKF